MRRNLWRQRLRRALVASLLSSFLLAVVGCGSDDDGGQPPTPTATVAMTPTPTRTTPPSPTPTSDPRAEACRASGGEVASGLCCLSTGDFPDLCATGACGCAPAESHEVQTCDCGEGKCFDGTRCVAPTEAECVASGGTVTTALCCLSAGDFPDLCVTGACGCAPGESHEVQSCECGEGKCFDGTRCVAPGEAGCVGSGGTVTTALCCLSAGDFPDLCVTGACGCAPTASHEVRVCQCGANRCFDSAKCVAE